LTELGFKAGGSQGLKYAEGMARIASTIPGLNAQLQTLAESGTRFTKLSVGMADVLHNFGVEGLGVYTKMQMAALGIKDASDELRTFGNIADGFKKSFSEAMLSSAQGIGSLLRLLGTGGLQMLGQIAGGVGAAGATRLALMPAVSQIKDWQKGRAVTRAEREGLRAMSQDAGGKLGTEVEVPVGIPPRAGVPGGIAAGAVFQVSTATINVGAVTGGVGGAVGGISDARRASAATVETTKWTKESADRLKALDRQSAWNKTAMIGLGAMAIAPVAQNLLGGKTGQVVGETLSGFGLGAQIGSALSPILGPFAAAIPVIMTAIPLIRGVIPEMPKAVGLKEQMEQHREATVKYALEAEGKTPREAELAGAIAVGKLVDKRVTDTERLYGSFGGALKARTALEEEKKQAEKEGGIAYGAVQAEMPKYTGIESEEERVAWMEKLDKVTGEYNNKLGGINDRLKLVRDRIADTVAAEQQRVLIADTIIKGMKAQAMGAAAMVDTESTLYDRELKLHGVSSETESIRQEELKAQRESVKMAEARVAEMRKLLRGDPTSPERRAEVAAAERDLTTEKERGFAISVKQVEASARIVSLQQQMVQSGIQIAQTMQHPEAVAALAAKSATIAAKEVELARERVRELLTSGRGEESEDVQKARAQVLTAQQQLASAVNITRRTWEDMFTEQLVGMPSGTYLNPSGPSGYDIYGGAYMTGMGPGARGPEGAGFGTYQEQTRERLGLSGTGKTGGEAMLSELVSLTSAVLDKWESGIRFTLDSESSGYMNSMEEAGGLNVKLLRDALYGHY
jgi:DNA-binding transcriptional regulator YiaG